MPRYFGLDAHKEVVQVCCLEADGTEVCNRRIPCTRDALLDWARNHLRADAQLAIEATTNTWALVGLVRPFVARVVVSNPMKTRAIAEARERA